MYTAACTKDLWVYGVSQQSEEVPGAPSLLLQLDFSSSGSIMHNMREIT